MSQLGKRALMESFIKLLNEMPLDKIKVKDIVEDCGVNRNTFYYHFKDIYALLDELFQIEVNKVIDENKKYLTWQDGFLTSMKFAIDNKRAVYHIYNSISREHLEWYLYQVTNSVMIDYVKEQAKDLNVPEEDIQFIADFYKFALVGIALNWIQKGMKEEPSVMIAKLGILFEGNIRKALENSRNER